MINIFLQVTAKSTGQPLYKEEKLSSAELDQMEKLMINQRNVKFFQSKGDDLT